MALALPAPVKSDVARLVARLEPELGDAARWVPRDNLHVTLAFLGAVADERIPVIVDALKAAAAGHPVIGTRVVGIGAFPSESRARVLWAGLDDPDRALASVAASVRAALTALGFALERRPFRAHLTIARMPRPVPLRLPELDAPVSAPFLVDAVTLFESKLGRPAARYEPMATVALRA